jgi:hypothetical protein
VGLNAFVKLFRLFEILQGNAEWDRCLLHEYDSLCLRPLALEQMPPGFWCIRIHDLICKDSKYRTYPHPPFIFDRTTFTQVWAAMHDRELMDARGAGEMAYTDHWFARMLSKAGIPLGDLGALAVDPWVAPVDHVRRQTNTSRSQVMQALHQRVRAGALVIHGMKRASELQQAERALHDPDCVRLVPDGVEELPPDGHLKLRRLRTKIQAGRG